jgi:sugar lactone lactonase YvrE
MKKSLRATLPLLAAGLLATEIRAEDKDLTSAQPFTGPVGTLKTEGPVSDGAGGLFFCNAQQEGLTFTWKSATRGNIAHAKADGTVEIVATLSEGQRGNGMRRAADGSLYVADQLGGAVLKVDPQNGAVAVYCTFPAGSGQPNDLALRTDGTLYVSFFNDGLWLVPPGGTAPRKVGEGFHNGIDLSPDETRLYSEQKTYDVAADGALSNPRPLLRVPPKSSGFSFTDGLRTDAVGNIYMARFGGPTDPADKKSPRRNGVVHIFAPDGTLLRNVEMPAGDVTNLTFGGPDGRTVFVTHPGTKGFISCFRAEIPGREK